MTQNSYLFVEIRMGQLKTCWLWWWNCQKSAIIILHYSWAMVLMDSARIIAANKHEQILFCTLAWWMRDHQRKSVLLMSFCKVASLLVSQLQLIKQHVNLPANVTCIRLDAGVELSLQYHCFQQTVCSWLLNYNASLFTLSLVPLLEISLSPDINQTQKLTHRSSRW